MIKKRRGGDSERSSKERKETPTNNNGNQPFPARKHLNNRGVLEKNGKKTGSRIRPWIVCYVGLAKLSTHILIPCNLETSPSWTNIPSSWTR